MNYTVSERGTRSPFERAPPRTSNENSKRASAIPDCANGGVVCPGTRATSSPGGRGPAPAPEPPPTPPPPFPPAATPLPPRRVSISPKTLSAALSAAMIAGVPKPCVISEKCVSGRWIDSSSSGSTFCITQSGERSAFSNSTSACNVSLQVPITLSALESVSHCSRPFTDCK